MPSPIIIALDLDFKDSLNLARKLDPNKCKLKVGSQLFTSSGPKVITILKDLGFEIFLDLKFHDIPNTVSSSVLSSVELGVWMVNVHASGGEEMLEAAVSVLKKVEKRPLLIGVTLLTSLDQISIEKIGIKINLKDQVIRLTKMCKEKGLDGVVCSPQEISDIRKEIGKDFLLVTPGIRTNSNLVHDQKRTATPKEAIENGANYIILGRDVLQSINPSKEVEKIYKEIS